MVKLLGKEMKPVPVAKYLGVIIDSSAKITAVHSLADICFLYVLIWLITCITLSVCVSVFLVLSILDTVI